LVCGRLEQRSDLEDHTERPADQVRPGDPLRTADRARSRPLRPSVCRARRLGGARAADCGSRGGAGQCQRHGDPGADPSQRTERHGQFPQRPVSDSTGSIWRTRPRGTVNDTPRSPWLRNSILAPTVGHFGVNGIAFRANALYAAVYDAGLIVKIPIGRTGRAGTPIVVARNAALKDADGIMFDTAGTLWVTSTRSAVVGSGALLTVSRTGKVTVVAEDPAWLDYPTQAVFGRTARDHHTLYITNGSFDADGPSNVTAIHVRTPWVHPM
jgi:sugar lactone lactonase YvrE